MDNNKLTPTTVYVPEDIFCQHNLLGKKTNFIRTDGVIYNKVFNIEDYYNEDPDKYLKEKPNTISLTVDELKELLGKAYDNAVLKTRDVYSAWGMEFNYGYDHTQHKEQFINSIIQP